MQERRGHVVRLHLISQSVWIPGIDSSHIEIGVGGSNSELLVYNSRSRDSRA